MRSVASRNGAEAGNAYILPTCRASIIGDYCHEAMVISWGLVLHPTFCKMIICTWLLFCAVLCFAVLCCALLCLAALRCDVMCMIGPAAYGALLVDETASLQAVRCSFAQTSGTSIGKDGSFPGYTIQALWHCARPGLQACRRAGM